MKNSKIQELLTALKPNEVLDFERYITSQNIESKKPAQFQFLYKNRHDCSSPRIKKKFFELFYTSKNYDDKKVRYDFTEICRALQGYFALSHLQNHSMHYHMALCDALIERNCPKNYLSFKKREKSHDQKLSGADAALQHYLNEYRYLLFQSPRAGRTEESNIEAAAISLDQFYLLRKLQLSCEMQNVKNVIAHDYRLFMLEEILYWVNQNISTVSPIILAYYYVYLSLRETDNIPYYKKLNTLVKENESSIPIAELRKLYQYQMNFCIKKINLGDTGFQNELFALYQSALKNGVLLLNGFLSQWDYKNIVTISLRLQEIQWAGSFIYQFKSSLHPDERENAFTYNEAYYHFYIADYSQVLKKLQKLNFTDLYYQLDSRALILKTYYEQEDEEAFRYFSQSFSLFIRRNRFISEYQRTIYLNLIQFAKKSFSARFKPEKAAQLLKALEERPQVADINWLRKKLRPVE